MMPKGNNAVCDCKGILAYAVMTRRAALLCHASRRPRSGSKLAETANDVGGPVTISLIFNETFGDCKLAAWIRLIKVQRPILLRILCDTVTHRTDDSNGVQHIPVFSSIEEIAQGCKCL